MLFQTVFSFQTINRKSDIIEDESQGFHSKHEDVGSLREDQNCFQMDICRLSLGFLFCLCHHQTRLCMDPTNMRNRERRRLFITLTFRNC